MPHNFVFVAIAVETAGGRIPGGETHVIIFIHIRFTVILFIVFVVYVIGAGFTLIHV